jgi:hypothetical protein
MPRGQQVHTNVSENILSLSSRLELNIVKTTLQYDPGDHSGFLHHSDNLKPHTSVIV